MHLVRPCTHNDVSSIESLVRDNHARISSLPRKRERLAERIEQSIRSFQQDASLGDGQFFLFVLEDTNTGQLLGCSGIAMNNEPKRPFYNYRMDEMIHASERYDVHTPVSVLHLTHELTGRNVLCSFAVRPYLVGSALFELISRARLMFMRQFAASFSDQLVVELQGVYGDEGQSAFWDSLGRNFFNMDYASAEYHVATKSRTLLAELMPVHPIYVTLLSKQSQAILGKYDESATETHNLLQREGFKPSPYIDIFDGGLVMLARRDKTRTFQEACVKTVRTGSVETGLQHIICNDQFENFRCGMVQLTDGLGEILRVDEAAMSQLRLDDGNEYYFAKL